jgi:hypothetical protein
LIESTEILKEAVITDLRGTCSYRSRDRGKTNTETETEKKSDRQRGRRGKLT